MPNQMSADARRINFIWDKDAYAELENLAHAQRMSVGELIRRTLEEKYKINPTSPIIQIRLRPQAKSSPPRPKKKSAPKRKRDRST